GMCSEIDAEYEKQALNWMSGALGLFGAPAAVRDIAKKVPGNYPTPGSELAQKDLQDLMDPGHESEIRNIQAEAMLNNLMANDEIIKTHDPEDVLDAFNEISQVAPRMSTSTAVMRDLIRKRLSGGAGALDQFSL